MSEWYTRGPGGVVSILLLGLQGVGKTTVAAKLARPDQSGLEREIVAGKEHVFEFAVSTTD